MNQIEREKFKENERNQEVNEDFSESRIQLNSDSQIHMNIRNKVKYSSTRYRWAALI